jgi:hypothetical protein
VECGEPVPKEPTTRNAFGMIDGGVICSYCLSNHRQTVWASTAALEAWETLVDPLDRSEMWKHFAMNQRTLGEVRRLSNQYICCLLGKKPRLHDWWNVIAKNDLNSLTEPQS